MTTIMGNGYNPDTLLLTPANAEALDVLVSGISGGTNDYVFAPGAASRPNTIFGLNKRIVEDDPRRGRRRLDGAREALHEPGRRSPASRPTPAPRTAATCGWSSTPSSAASAPAPPSGSPPPSMADKKTAVPSKKAGQPKKAGPSKRKRDNPPAVSLGQRTRSATRGGRGRRSVPGGSRTTSKGPRVEPKRPPLWGAGLRRGSVVSKTGCVNGRKVKSDAPVGDTRVKQS